MLWNPKVYYRIHKCPPTVPILSHLDPVPTPTSHFLKIRLHIITPSKPGFRKWPLSLRFPHQNPVYASLQPHTSYMPRQPHSSRFYQPKDIGWGVQIINTLNVELNPVCYLLALLGAHHFLHVSRIRVKLFIMWFSTLSCYLFPVRPKYSPQHCILKHPQPTFLP